MKRVKQFLLLLSLLIYSSGFKLYAQSEDFLIGSWLNSNDNRNISYYSNYWQIKRLGLNTVCQRNIVSVPLIGQQSNFDSLMLFNTIIAVNDSAPVSAFNENNVDWIYYFTNALYSKWEAEGSPYFNSSEAVGIKHNNIGYPTADGWSSGSREEDIGKYFILGPNYSQYMKYVYTNKYNSRDTTNPIINYSVNFRMKLVQPQEEIFPVARIIVSVKNAATGVETNLVDSILSSDQLTTEYTGFYFDYNYGTISAQYNGPLNYTGTPPPGPAWYAPQSTASAGFFDANLKIQFKVQRLTDPEIVVDYIEVYDAGNNGIWANYFIGQGQQEMLNRITSYNQKFTSLGTKLKYYFTIGEPHSIDCFIPIKTVQSILRDTLGISRDLITLFYPGWNNYRDSVDIIEKWIKIAQPKQFMFWYFPYWVENTDEEGLSALRAVLQQAYVRRSSFYVSLQTWGYLLSNGSYYWYRTPNPAQVSAEVMLTLAHGVKGILFEPYYSYTSWLPEFPSENPTVLAIVDKLENGRFPERDIYWRIQEITQRLKGKLGSTLLGLNYTGDYINFSGGSLGGTVHTKDYLSIWQGNQHVFYHAGMLEDKNDGNNKYFLIINELTDPEDGDRIANIYVNLHHTLSGYQNWRVRDVEQNFDASFNINNHLNFQQMLSAGDGKLFQVAPVVKSGGTLAVNDTITSNISLEDNLTISNGVNLVISNSIYTLKDTVTLLGTGMIIGSGYMKIESAGRININSFSRGLFKSVAGANPKLFWYFPPEFSSVEKFKIYRQLESNSLELIAQVDGETFEYVDNEITVFIGQTPANESYVDYYVEAVGLIEEEYQSTISSNTVRYRMNRDMQKQLSGDENKVTEYEPSNNYPNPFNPTTRIKYAIPQNGLVTIKVFDILGNEVSTLVNELKEEGRYEISFDANNFSIGIFFYELTRGKFTSRKKMLVFK